MLYLLPKKKKKNDKKSTHKNKNAIYTSTKVRKQKDKNTGLHVQIMTYIMCIYND